MSNKPIHSPSYPSLSLEACINHTRKIEESYRTSAVDRKDAANLMGYSSLSGPAGTALAALASYGLVEKAGKGMLRVTPLAVSIIHPQSDSERKKALFEAAQTPKLFRDIREQFPDLSVPPEQGVKTHLNRAGFNPNSVPKAVKAFLDTARFVEQLGKPESHVPDSGDDVESDPPDDETQQTGTNSPSAIPPEDTIQKELPPATGQRKAVFPVSEGDVTFLFPDGMTEEGIEELEAYLAVFLKKAKRKAAEN